MNKLGIMALGHSAKLYETDGNDVEIGGEHFQEDRAIALFKDTPEAAEFVKRYEAYEKLWNKLHQVIEAYDAVRKKATGIALPLGYTFPSSIVVNAARLLLKELEGA